MKKSKIEYCVLPLVRQEIRRIKNMKIELIRLKFDDTHSYKYKPFQCEHCSYKCKTNPQLKNHYRKEHNQFDYYKCSECNLKFNKKSDLKHHLKEHEFDNLNKILNNTQSFININNINNNFINLYNHSDPLKLEHVTCNKKEWKQKLKVIKEISFGFFALDDLN